MNKITRRMVTWLTVFAFTMQLFAPALIYAQDAQKQKAVIEDSVKEYQKTYDQIMELKPIELGSLADFTIKAIDWAKDTWNDVKGFFGGESKEEKAKREAEEKYNAYKAQIDRANEQIKQLQADAKETMATLKSGAVDAAGKMDTEKSLSSLEATGGAMGIYQKALKEAGDKLLDVADGLSTAATVLGGITLVLAVVAVPFPVVAPAIPILKGVTIALEIANGVITAAGNTLITASEKAITSDKDFMQAAAYETSLAALETTAGAAIDASGMGVVSKTAAQAGVTGLTGTLRDVYRTGNASPAQIGQIAAKNFGNAAISSTVNAVFTGVVGATSRNMTADILSGVDVNSKFKTDAGQAAVNDLVETGLGQAVDGAKSNVNDSLSIKDREENPDANAQPGLDGSW